MSGDQLKPGDWFYRGRYLLRSCLGQGAFGVVWRALDLRTEQEVALKVLLHEHNQRSSVAHFAREFRIGLWLDHPLLPQMHHFDFEQESQRYFFAMELVQGQELNQLDLSRHQSLKVFIELLDALAYAHARGVIHRDLKPENVLIEPQSLTIKLLDFGVVRVVDAGLRELLGESEEEVGRAIGSVLWMSPEQASGESECVGPASDLYALGVMLYELISGAPPFDGRLVEVLYKHLMLDPPPLKPLAKWLPMPAGLDELIAALLQKRYVDRPESAAEVRQRLKAILAQEHTQPTDFTPQQQLGKKQLALSLSETIGPELLPKSTRPGEDECVATMFTTPDLQEGELETQREKLFDLVEAQLIGRESQCLQLIEQVDRVIQSHTAKLLLLQGSSGMGKTRLARWLSEYVQRAGQMRALRISTEPNSTFSAALYSSILRALRSPRLERKPLIQRVEEYFGPGEFSLRFGEALLSYSVLGVNEGDTWAEQPVLIQAIAQFAQKPRPRPLLIWIDDQGSDGQSPIRRWLEQVSLVLTNQAALVLWSTPSTQLASAIEISLPPLQETDLLELINVLVPGASQQQRRELAHRSQGNPGRARKLARTFIKGQSADHKLRHTQSMVLSFDPQQRELLMSLALVGGALSRSDLTRLQSLANLPQLDLLASGLLTPLPGQRQELFGFNDHDIETALAQAALSDAAKMQIFSVAVEMRLSLALDAMGIARWDLAHRELERAWSLLERGSYPPQAPHRLAVYDGLARIFARQREADQLLEHTERWLAATTHQEWRGLALGWRALAVGMLEDWDAEELALDEAWRMAQASAEPGIQGWIYLRQGQAARRSDTTQAQKLLENAQRHLQHAAQTHPADTFWARTWSLLAADACRFLADIHSDKGDFASADRLISTSLDCYLNNRDSQAEARAHLQRARALRRWRSTGNAAPQTITERLGVAIRAARHALENLDDRLGQAILLWESAQVMVLEGRQDEALTLYEHAASLFGTARARSGQAACLNQLGEMARAHAKLNDAESYYLQFLKLAIELENDTHVGAAYINLGWLKLEAGALTPAYHYFSEAKSLLANNPRLSPILHCGLLECAVLGHNDSDQVQLLNYCLNHLPTLAKDADARRSFGRMAQALPQTSPIHAALTKLKP